MRKMPLVCLVLAAACLTAQRPQPKPLPWENLHVLPRDISREELYGTMRAWSQSLGVRCDHCHVQLPFGATEKPDFVSDEKPEKNIARGMLRMTRRMNTDYVAILSKDGANVTCYTCHHGKVMPDSKIPPRPTA